MPRSREVSVPQGTQERMDRAADQRSAGRCRRYDKVPMGADPNQRPCGRTCHKKDRQRGGVSRRREVSAPRQGTQDKDGPCCGSVSWGRGAVCPARGLLREFLRHPEWFGNKHAPQGGAERSHSAVRHGEVGGAHGKAVPGRRRPGRSRRIGKGLRSLGGTLDGAAAATDRRRTAKGIFSKAGFCRLTRPGKQKGAAMSCAPFGNRTPGNNRYRCFLSDLAGLAARPPSGSPNSCCLLTIDGTGENVNRSVAAAGRPRCGRCGTHAPGERGAWRRACGRGAGRSRRSRKTMRLAAVLHAAQEKTAEAKKKHLPKPGLFYRRTAVPRWWNW